MIDDIEILFGEERPKRAKKRERIKKKHTKKLENIRLGFIFLHFLSNIKNNRNFCLRYRFFLKKFSKV